MNRSKFTRVLFCLIIPIVCSSQTIIYVNVNATGSNNGSSWTNAFTTLNPAIASAVSGSEIWVAQGTYQHVSAGFGFVLQNGVGIYGGFNGTEVALSQRDFVQNVTILKGNNSRVINNNSLNQPNPINNTAVLDGFTITGGTVTTVSNPSPQGGGGILNYYASPTLRNLIVTGNSSFSKGGGIYNFRSECKVVNVTVTNNKAPNGGGIYNENGRYTPSGEFYPEFTRVSVISNSASSVGAGIFNENSAPLFINCLIKANARPVEGGGMYSNNSGIPNQELTFINTLFTENKASYGAAMYCKKGKCVLMNVTISGNTANSSPGGIRNDESNLKIINSIIYGNTKGLSVPSQYNENFIGDSPLLYSSCIGGWTTPSVNVDPQFLDPANGNYELSGQSPLINQGNSSMYTSTEVLDLNETPRVVGSAIDPGAFEFQTAVSIKEHLLQTGLKVHPNPASQQVFLSFETLQGKAVITLADLCGKEVMTRSVDESLSLQLDLSDIVPGVYILKATTLDGVFVEKLVIEGR